MFDLVQDMELDLLLALQALMEQVTPEDTEAEQVSRLFFDFLAEHRKKMRLLLNNERSRAFCLRLDSLIMPFFEKKVRQGYAVPPEKEQALRRIMEFVAAGYYRFFMLALEDEGIDIRAEAALCAKLSDACLGEAFGKK